MPNFIIAYPEITGADFNWVQSIRKQKDGMYDAVNPHVTLVFGTDKLSIGELYEHTQNKLKDSKSFKVVFGSVKVVKDEFRNVFHAFLIPKDGYKEIIDLHDKLYTDQLASELKSDIPFIPHITIGMSPNEDEMNALAGDINSTGKTIVGKINTVNIVQYDGTKVVDCEKVSLL